MSACYVASMLRAYTGPASELMPWIAHAGHVICHQVFGTCNKLCALCGEAMHGSLLTLCVQQVSKS